MLDPISSERVPGWLEGYDSATALVVPESGLSLRFGELHHYVDELARELVSLGVRPGQVVSYSLLHGPESVRVFRAILRAGAGAATLNPAYTDQEVGRYLADLHQRVMIVQDATAPAAA